MLHKPILFQTYPCVYFRLPTKSSPSIAAVEQSTTLLDSRHSLEKLPARTRGKGGGNQKVRNRRNNLFVPQECLDKNNFVHHIAHKIELYRPNAPRKINIKQRPHHWQPPKEIISKDPRPNTKPPQTTATKNSNSIFF